MLFNSPLYGVFLVVTWAVFWMLRDASGARTPMLVLASYAFYFYGTWESARDEPVPVSPMAWAWLCLAIIIVGSTMDFVVARAMARTIRPGRRRALLLASVVYYLGVLGLFKYWNFVADTLAAGAAATGLSIRPAHLRLVLPFGISFFTFETMSYTIDVYRGELAPSRRYPDYLLFVCFFPHLVAGPIVRPAQMLPQIATPPVADVDRQARGLWRIAAGLAKKMVIGDYLAQAIVDRVFAAPERFTSLEVLLAVYAYAIQIYVDFSGYTDVAIGSAALFGYELPENFARPYLARDLQDFWRRWHISLSTWLRDYLYKPLGGSRGGAVATYRSLMITMVLGGLWHGASWTFVVWGALHGGALAVTRMAQRAGTRRAATGRSAARWLRDAVATVATFHFVCFAWVFFRAPSLAHAGLVLWRVSHGAWSIDHVAPRVGAVVGIGALLHVAPRRLEAWIADAFVRRPALVQGLVLAAAAMGIHWLAGATPEPFVYGQF